MFKTRSNVNGEGLIFGLIANFLMIILAGFYMDICFMMGYTSPTGVFGASIVISTLLSYIINPITFKWVLVEGIIWFSLPILLLGFSIPESLILAISSISIPTFIGALLGYRIRKLQKKNRIEVTEQNQIKGKWYSNWKGKGWK